ncbi:hypothetical protein NEDG_01762 [Nematocida displodere]|uniref:BRCT domain-containing protein n=1 Tax=Nematocida displodere TaxID=1805483 RepID=A0A177EGR3_9MICR|nr:hypothetical protein NEDG_01762 [Nematocida displodere]
MHSSYLKDLETETQEKTLLDELTEVAKTHAENAAFKGGETREGAYNAHAFHAIPRMAVPERLLATVEMEPPRAPQIVMALSGTTSVEFNFICSTIESVSDSLGCPIHLRPDHVDACTHLIVHTDQEELCARTYKYLKCLVKRKSIVTFLWYIELFDASKKPLDDELENISLGGYIRELTRNHLAKGDRMYGRSDAPVVAHNETKPHPFFKALNVIDSKSLLSEIEKDLILSNGGLINSRKAKRDCLNLQFKHDLYNFISAGSDGFSLGLVEKKAQAVGGAEISGEVSEEDPPSS